VFDILRRTFLTLLIRKFYSVNIKFQLSLPTQLVDPSLVKDDDIMYLEYSANHGGLASGLFLSFSFRLQPFGSIHRH